MWAWLQARLTAPTPADAPAYADMLPQHTAAEASDDDDDDDSSGSGAAGGAAGHYPTQKWARLPAPLRRSYPAVHRLMQCTGVRPAKALAMRIMQRGVVRAKLPQPQRVPEAHHYLLTGSPGTGKRTVAKMMANTLKSAAIESSQSQYAPLIKTAARMVHSAARCQRGSAAYVSQIVSVGIQTGVLVIDDIYTLLYDSQPAAREMLAELLAAADAHHEQFTIIMAGQCQDTQQLLQGVGEHIPGGAPPPAFAAAHGLFKQVHFPDFTDEQLVGVLRGMVQAAGWTLHSDAVALALVTKVQQQAAAGSAHTNAWGVQEAWMAARDASLHRCGFDGTPDACIQLVDVAGPPPSRDSTLALHQAMCDLEAMSGMQPVHAAITQVIHMAEANHRRVQRGQLSHRLPLHRILLGNAGTGKSTVARIYGRVLAAHGLTASPTPLMCCRGELMGDTPAFTHSKTARLMQRCKGRLLAILSAHTLQQSALGRTALLTITHTLQHCPVDGMAMLMMGPVAPMGDMLRGGPPGLLHYMAAHEPLRCGEHDDGTVVAAALAVRPGGYPPLPRRPHCPGGGYGCPARGGGASSTPTPASCRLPAVWRSCPCRSGEQRRTPGSSPREHHAAAE